MELFLNPGYFNSNENENKNFDLTGNEYIEPNPIYNHQNTKDEDEKNFEDNILSFDLKNNRKFVESNNDENARYYNTKFSTEITTNQKEYIPNKQIFEVKKISKIFLIKKKKKTERKRGRFALNFNPLYKPKHDKLAKDNIISKIKRHFVISTLNYINKKYKEFLSSKKKGKKHPLLMKIINKYYKEYSTKANREFFNLYIYQLFSEDLSHKITETSKDYNRKQIKLLFKKNKAKEVIEIMNVTVKEMYEIYISNEINDYNFEKDFNSIVKIEEEEKEEQKEEEQEEKDKYRNKVKEMANNLFDFINRKGNESKK